MFVEISNQPQQDKVLSEGTKERVEYSAGAQIWFPRLVRGGRRFQSLKCPW